MNSLSAVFAGSSVGPLGIVVWTVVAFALGALGGAAGGFRLAGKDLGGKLAALMGAMFGPVAVAPAVFAALLVLALLAH